MYIKIYLFHEDMFIENVMNNIFENTCVIGKKSGN